MQVKKNLEIETNGNLVRGENDFISELKTEESKKLLSFLQVSLSSNTCGIIIINNKGDIISVNDEFQKIWGISDIKLFDNNSARCQTYLESQVEKGSQLRELFKKKKRS